MNDINQCQNRKTKQRVSIEVCKYHLETKDPICRKRLGGAGTEYKCEVTRKLLKEKEDAS